MKGLKDIRGQALIETAIVLILLLTILFGISEFSRAWYTKNSLKNAVRSGARLAAVTCGVSDVSNAACPGSCPGPAPDPTADCNVSSSVNNSAIIGAVCCSLGAQTRTLTTVTMVTTAHDPSGLTADDIKVSGSTTFNFVLGGGIWPWPKSTTITTDATMRHE